MQVLALTLLTALFGACHGYKIGVGIADITGPAAEVAFMGYAHPNQKGEGVHLRQFARSFIVDDGKERMVFVSCDIGMMGTFVRREVIRQLSLKFGNTYNEGNVMLSGTHTHSTPGGFLMDIIFDLNTFGYVTETFNAYARGITRSISRAHESMTDGKIKMTTGEILDSNINRSPTAYLKNPTEERSRYQYNVDKTFVQLKFEASDATPLGVITWYAVHATSMNNTNKLISSDNVGYASVLFEQKMNPGALIGKGPFVAAFASSNLGDVSPNIKGPMCVPSGNPCDPETSSCSDSRDSCIASGPGKDMQESTEIIATRIFQKAYDAYQSKGVEITGRISVVHEYVDMPEQNVTLKDPKTGAKKTVFGCLPAMGYSFAAGTTDGPGAFSFQQGTTSTNPLWNALTNFIAPPSKEQIECQAPKPILLSTGEMNFPFEWQPSIVSTQLAQLGPLAIACVPGEFTTMSGRRMRENLRQEMGLDKSENVIIAGLCNTYSDYITTPEEYTAQRYEGASTIYGPHTLSIYLEQYKRLARHIKQNTKPKTDVVPPEYFNDAVSLLPPVLFDVAGWGKSFGDVVRQPRKTVKVGDTVVASFVSGHPRNNQMQEGSFLAIEYKDELNVWIVVATDANWETKFVWRRKSSIFGTSEVDIIWKIPEGTTPGIYRIRHFGYFKYVYNRRDPYQGTTETFTVTN